MTTASEPASGPGDGMASAAPGEAPAEALEPSEPVELELKYDLLEPPIGEAILAADELAGFRAAGPVDEARHEDRYLETSDRALVAAGVAARLRFDGAGTTLTVKSTGGVEGALRRRVELEAVVDPRLVPADWPDSAARSRLLQAAGGAPLVELVTIRQRRQKRILEDPSGAAVELSLDEVGVMADGEVIEAFTELEVELRSGDEAALARIGEALEATAGVVPAATSKLARALTAIERRADRAASGPSASDGLEPPSETTPPARRRKSSPADIEAPSAAEAGPPPLVVGKTPGVVAEDLHAEAGRKVIRFHLARMLAREAGTRAGADPEDLHDMRVATRRMRAAWRVFGDGFRPERTRRFRRRLREMAARLGAVRDLDVLIASTEAYAEASGPEERVALEPLIGTWRSQREDGRALLVRELDSVGYRKFVDEYRDFVLTVGRDVVPVPPMIPHRVRDTAPSRIWDAYQQVRAYESVLRWADVPTLHELRIAGKRLRYALEFVREPLGPDAAPLIARVAALQDHLGLLNDADVAATMARAFLVERAGTLSDTEATGIGRFLMSREREVARLRRTVGPAWRGVAGLTFRRLLGRVLAGL